MELTPEQQARVDRVRAILHYACEQNGVVPIAVTTPQTIRLPDGNTRTEVTAQLDFAVVANWQPPQSEPIQYPKEDTDNENEIPAHANGTAVHADL